MPLLSLPAAIVHTTVGEGVVSNALGMGSCFALALCIQCGLRYKQLNHATSYFGLDNSRIRLTHYVADFSAYPLSGRLK